MAKITVNGQQILGDYLPDMDLNALKIIYGDTSDIQLLLSKSDLKTLTQKGIIAALSKPGEPVDRQRVAMSLIGKTSNALSAVLDIHAQVYARLATAQSIADVRSAIEPAIPLMTRVAALRESGELLSVQHAQGMDNVDAVIEGLVAMTTCAKVIAEHQQQIDAQAE